MIRESISIPNEAVGSIRMRPSWTPFEMFGAECKTDGQCFPDVGLWCLYEPRLSAISWPLFIDDNHTRESFARTTWLWFSHVKYNFQQHYWFNCWNYKLLMKITWKQFMTAAAQLLIKTITKYQFQWIDLALIQWITTKTAFDYYLLPLNKVNTVKNESN